MLGKADRSSLESMKSHGKVCKWLLVVLAAILILQSIGLIADICYFLWIPSDQVRLTDSGDAVKVQALFGYFRFSSESLPPSYVDVSGKILGLSSSVFSLLLEKIPMLIILWTCIQIFRKMIWAHSPFDREISRRIKVIGWIVLYLGAMERLLFQIGVSLVSCHEIWFHNPFQLTILAAGAVILAAGDIFAYGCELQKESDELL